MKTSGKNASKGTGFGIKRAGRGPGVNKGNLPFVYPTKELADEWLQFAAKLGADFGTYACLDDGECGDVYKVTKSLFCYAKVDSPDGDENLFHQEFSLIENSKGEPLSCKPSEMAEGQAEELVRFLFIDEVGTNPGRMGMYAARLLRCLNSADKDACYEIFNPGRCYWDEKEIVLLEGGAEIGEMEYQRARNLESIVIPEGVVKIGDCAFFGCQKLKNVKFPSTLKEIGKRAFRGCGELVKLNLPKGLERIGIDAFDAKWSKNKKVLECSEFSELDAYAWIQLIRRNPKLGERCRCWDEFNSSAWTDILRVAPQFASKCKKWSAFKGSEISLILCRQPKLVSEWKSLSKMDTFDWVSLLGERPALADHCKSWGEFRASDWAYLLSKRPQFADRCNAWAQFKDADWDRIVGRSAKFKKLRKEYSQK